MVRTKGLHCSLIGTLSVHTIKILVYPILLLPAMSPLITSGWRVTFFDADHVKSSRRNAAGFFSSLLAVSTVRPKQLKKTSLNQFGKERGENHSHL